MNLKELAFEYHDDLNGMVKSMKFDQMRKSSKDKMVSIITHDNQNQKNTKESAF